MIIKSCLSSINKQFSEFEAKNAEKYRKSFLDRIKDFLNKILSLDQTIPIPYCYWDFTINPQDSFPYNWLSIEWSIHHYEVQILFQLIKDNDEKSLRAEFSIQDMNLSIEDLIEEFEFCLGDKDIENKICHAISSIIDK